MPLQEHQKSYPSKLLHMVIAALIFIVFFGMLNQMPWLGTSIREDRGTLHYRENPWTLTTEDDTVVSSQLTLPKYMPLERNTLYRLSTTLTYDGAKDANPSAFLHLDHAYCRVLLDDQILFSAMPADLQKWDASKSAGFIYKDIALPHDCLGKTLTIEMLPTLTISTEYGLPDIFFGDYYTTLYRSIFRDAPHNIIVILCALLGMASILFSTTSLHRSDYREGVSIGIFSLLFALYLITECPTNTYFIGNPYYLYLLNYIPFSLLPISLLGFMRERLQEKAKKCFTSVISIELLLFVVEMVLHFGGIYDMRELIPIIHLIYFINILLVTLWILLMKEPQRRRSLVLQLTPILIGMSLDALIYWLHWEIGINDATFTILGVLIFLIIEVSHMWKNSLTIYSESIRSRLYRQMAYIDDLTGIENRRAYEEALQRIAAGSISFEHMIVLSIDVNNLKKINDNHGHQAGDAAIRATAQIIKEALENFGHVYRIGGDEFIAFLYDTSLAQCESLLETVQREIDAFNEDKDYTLSLAMGYIPLDNDDILEAVKQADYKMYADKSTQKHRQM